MSEVPRILPSQFRRAGSPGSTAGKDARRYEIRAGKPDALQTLPRRFGNSSGQEIAHTVASPGELAEEMNHLFKVLSG